jgi:hypothetical protein
MRRMGKRGWLAGSLGTAIALLLASQAGAAVTIGSNLNSSGAVSQCGAGVSCTFLLSTLPAANSAPGGIRSPIDGVVVRWRIKSGSSGNAVNLRVLRPAEGTTWTGAGTSATGTTVFGTSPYFSTRLPIRSGDALGLNDSSAGLFFGNTAGTFLGFTPALADGETRGPIMGGGPRELLIQADVEPDADADGFGDETQDPCLGQSGPDGCDREPPDTTITAGPGEKVKTKKKRARVSFEFVSSEPGSSFECSLDGGPFAPCTSPVTEKVRAKPKAKAHEFGVRATDPAGNVDPTPATDEFKAKRKR